MLACFGALAGKDALPQRPDPPTEAGCAAYQRAVHREWQEITNAHLACMSKTQAHIAIGRECDYVSHRVHTSTQAWPHCFHADQDCAVLVRQDDADACMKEARRDASKMSQADKTIMTLKDLEQKIQNGKKNVADGLHTLNDPEGFLREQLAAYLESKFLSNLSLNDARGQFTERGQTMMQETYDYLFSHTAGNPALRASNPIIAAIQGSSTDELRRVHSQLIHDLEDTLVSIDDLSRSAYSSAAMQSSSSVFTRQAPLAAPAENARSTGVRPASPARRPEECAILDSPSRTRLAVDEPERYQALSARCGSGNGAPLR